MNNMSQIIRKILCKLNYFNFFFPVIYITRIFNWLDLHPLKINHLNIILISIQNYLIVIEFFFSDDIYILFYIYMIFFLKQKKCIDHEMSHL